MHDACADLKPRLVLFDSYDRHFYNGDPYTRGQEHERPMTCIRRRTYSIRIITNI